MKVEYFNRKSILFYLESEIQIPIPNYPRSTVGREMGWVKLEDGERKCNP